MFIYMQNRQVSFKPYYDPIVASWSDDQVIIGGAYHAMLIKDMKI